MTHSFIVLDIPEYELDAIKLKWHVWFKIRYAKVKSLLTLTHDQGVVPS